MVMGAANLDRRFKSGITGASDRLSAFDAAIKLCKQRRIEYLFITGNLFDSEKPNPSVIKHVSDEFYSIPSTRVIIAPGSCDPSCAGSCYQTQTWPPNVYVFPAGEISEIEFNDKLLGTTDRDYLFSGGKESGRKGVRIYGRAFDGHFCKESLLISDTGKTPRLSSTYLNVLVIHGHVVEDGQTSSFNPIPLDVLKDCGFDLCAVGGEKTNSRKGNILVPGHICPSDFSETGQCGVYVGEVSDGRYLSAEFVDVSPVKYEVIKFDVSGRTDCSPEAIAKDVKRLAISDNCTRFEIIGELSFDENIDVDAIGEILRDSFPLVEVVDKTFKNPNLRLYSAEKTFRGMYTATIWETVHNAREEQKKTGSSATYREKNYENAVNLGLKIVDNMNLTGVFTSLEIKAGELQPEPEPEMEIDNVMTNDEARDILAELADAIKPEENFKFVKADLGDDGVDSADKKGGEGL